MRISKLSRKQMRETPLVELATFHMSGSNNGLRLTFQQVNYTGPYFDLNMTLGEAEEMFRNGLSFIEAIRRNDKPGPLPKLHITFEERNHEQK